MFGEEDNLPDVLRVVRESAVERLQHRVRLAHGERFERARHFECAGAERRDRSVPANGFA